MTPIPPSSRRPMGDPCVARARAAAWTVACVLVLLGGSPVHADPIPLASGTAAQSSQLGGFSASNALDQTVNFTHTLSGDTNATWQVLLPQSYSFSNVEVFNREASDGTTGCCPSRLRDITIQIVDFDGNVAADFTGGTVTYSSPLLNPENVLGGGSASSGPVSLTANPGGAVGNMIRIKRTADPDLSGSGGAGNADEGAVLSIDLVTAEGSEGINSFTATPTTILSGAPVTLAWSVADDAAAVSIDQGIGDVRPLTTNGSGSLTLNPGPQATTTYRLTVERAGGGEATADATVTVDNSPRIASFSADAASVAPGTQVTLEWDVANFSALRLNGVELDPPGSSLVVAPLVTTTYTLTATNGFGTASATLTITVVDVPNFIGATGRFVEVVKNDLNNTRLHLSEIEVFRFGIEPDEADADGTSRNDLVQSGNPAFLIPPTTTTLEHGSPATVIDGDLESGGSIWSTANGLGTQPRYLLDLGTTETIGTVRLFGRADTCCPERLQNVTVNLYADDGAGNPGALVHSADFPGTAPAGNVGPAELSLAIPDPGIRNFTIDRQLIAAGEPVTLSWVVNTATTGVSIDQGIGDVTALTNPDGAGSLTLDPGPPTDTVYTLTAERPTGTSIASVAVTVTKQPLIRSFSAQPVVAEPGTSVELAWDVVNAASLDLDGTDVTGSTGATVHPDRTATYTLTAANPDGTTTATVRVRVVLPGEPVISEFMADNEGGSLVDEDGEPSDWIEIRNTASAPLSLDGYFLTDDPAFPAKWRFPAVTLPAGGHLVVFASGNDRTDPGSPLHTNFSLARSGEYLALVMPDGATITSEFAPFPPQRPDVSFGVDPSAFEEGYFLTPTPGAANAAGFTGFVADTRFSVDRGFHDAPVDVAITTATAGAEIRYTLDGTKPTESTGLVYTAPIRISETTVLRAAAFKPGFVPTNVDTHTYLFTADVVAQPTMMTSITQDPVYGPQMDAALKSVPSISLVFQGDVDRTEREVSMEMINFEAGSAQVDAGLSRYGNYVTNFAKRGIRIAFRSAYGPKKLDFPVFDGFDYPIPPAAEIDSLDLRSGNHDMSERGAYLSNRFTDDSMLEMGNLAPHGRFVHVYLNGRYWGQYHLRERWNGAMLSEYFGGTKDDYEAINANNTGNEFLVGDPYDGTGEYWNEARALVSGPSPFASAQGHIDIANVVDFMLLWTSGNSESEFRSAGSVPLGVPFKFFMKDADGWLRAPGHSVTHNGPLNIMTALRNEGAPDYKTLLADRIHRHFFNDGALTPARNIARLRKRVDESRLSFLAEAARWNYRSPASWESYQANLMNNHFPGLTATMIGRFRSAGMYPTIDAPAFNQHGGPVAPGFQLAIAAPAGTIYYTLDGSDPRLPQDPVEVGPPVTLVAENAPKSAWVPASAGDRLTDGSGRAWTEAGYDDAGWIDGTGGVGYETGSGYEPYLGIDVEAAMSGSRTSCLVRIPFSPAAGALDGMNSAELRVRYDDGFVAYLNGTEIARRNFAGAPDGDSQADASHSDGAAVVFESIDVSAHLDLLEEGTVNVLALHGLNVSSGSSDFLISAELRVRETSGGGLGGGISPTALVYSAPVPIDGSVTVRSRVLSGGEWSALNEAAFVQQSDALVVAELMYNPSPATPAEIAAGFGNSEDFEFIEFLNTGATPLDLDGIHFADGIEFAFPGDSAATLPAGGRVLVVSNRLAFEFRHGSGHPIAGEFTGRLRDEGERIEIVDGLGATIRAFTYDNNAPWPTAAAGLGASLVLMNPSTRPDHDLPASWRASTLPGGTPGAPDVETAVFDTWADANGIADPIGDDDSDGQSNFLEFMLGTNPHQPGQDNLPVAAIERLAVDGAPAAPFLTITFTHRLAATDVRTTAETSTDLTNWSSGPGFTALHRRTYHGNGFATSTYRSANPIATDSQSFLRARFDQTPVP